MSGRVGEDLKKLIVLVVVLLVLAGGVGYAYLPRGRGLDAAVAATLAVLNIDISAQKGTADFAPALDGDLLANGDVVKSSSAGRAVLTFFDGSTLTVETGAIVKVTTLNKLASGGIQLVIEQTIGRTWASVAKLKTPDSKFEIRTPTSTAAVRGTAFETIVTTLPDGTTSVTYKCDDGSLLVTANSGGTTTVDANTQVTINQGQAAPASSTPTPPGPVLRLTSSVGIGYAATAPTGETCGSAGNKAEMPGCLVNGNVVTIREPVAGRYSLMMTSAAAAANATVKVEALRGTAVEATQTFTRTFALGDLIRSAFTYGLGTPQTVGAFEPAEQITSECGALATGRVFSSGPVDARYDQLSSFAATNKATPASFVVTDNELVQSVQQAIADAAGNNVATMQDVSIKTDAAGIHVSGSLATPLGTFATTGDVVAGTVNGKLVIRVRSLSAGPLPSALLEQIQGAIDSGLSEFTSTFPMVVRRVVLRPGCLGILGSTP